MATAVYCRGAAMPKLATAPQVRSASAGASSPDPAQAESAGRAGELSQFEGNSGVLLSIVQSSQRLSLLKAP
jgi:hypothetical protein